MKQLLPEIISYDKVWSQEIDFDDDEQENPTDKMYDILQKAGFDMNEIQKQTIEKGGVSILAKDLPVDVFIHKRNL